MKELSIEEKVKRYDEAIKRVEDIVGGKCPKPFVFTEGLFDYIFPELKESEELTEFERAVKQVMEEAIECGDTHNLKADAEMLLSLVHKSAWSEEDDIMKQNCHQMLALLRPNSSELIKDIIDNCHHWLKSLKNRVQPQNTWKPSDEQMDALHYVTNFDYGGHKATLVSLYEQLKKLKGGII